MKYMSYFVFVVLGFALVSSGPALANDSESGFKVFDSVAPEDSFPGASRFSSEQLTRIHELRAWLASRKLMREQGIATGVPRLFPHTSPLTNTTRIPTLSHDRELLTPLGQRYALGFHRPTVSSDNAGAGRGGRDESPVYPARGGSNYQSVQTVPSEGSGILISGSRKVIIGNPEHSDSE